MDLKFLCNFLLALFLFLTKYSLSQHTVISESNLKFLCSSLNLSADPCEDFYNYACGNWVASNSLKNGEEELSVFSRISEDITKEIREILESNNTWMSGENLPITKARLFYKSCINTETIEELWAQPLFEYINYLKIPDFCTNETNISYILDLNNSWNMYEALKFTQTNFFISTAFFDIDAVNDYQKNNEKVIKIEDTGFSLQQEIYTSQPNVVKAYRKYVHNVIQLLGYNCSGLYERIEAVLDLEEDIAKFGSSKFSFDADDHHRIMIDELTLQIPDFPWLNHLRAVFNDSQITGNSSIFVSSINKLYYIVSIMNKTPKIILANYLLWHSIRDRIIHLSHNFTNLREEFKNEISSNKYHPNNDEDSRKNYCTEITNSYFGITIAGDYIKKHFSEESLEEARRLLTNIVETIKLRISAHEWLDKKTLAKSIEKIDAISPKVGYPEYIFNLTYLRDRYDGVNITENEFFFNVVRLDNNYRKKYLQKLHQPTNKQKWSMLPQTVNAMYQFFHNEIIIPAGILRPPFFYPDSHLPVSLNYGAIGSVIGHEITHAFDSTGRKFDKDGMIVKEWWSGEAVKEFNQRAICFQEQYSKYKPNDQRAINGVQTLAENIADNGGVMAALMSLESTGHINEIYDIMGTSFTSRQLFFIAFAQGYCTKSIQEFDELELLLQAHSPSKYRVIGTLSNTEKFAEEFKCDSKTKMNPEKRCKIW